MFVDAEGIDSLNATNGLPDGSRKFAGKFDSVDDMENGYLNILTNDSRLSAENEQLRRRIEAMAPMLENRTNGSAGRSSALDTLAEATSVDKDQLANAFYAVTREMVQAELQPLYQEAGARQRVSAEIPDYQKFEPEVLQFVNSNPEIRAEVDLARKGGAHVSAMKYAYNEWRASQGQSRTARVSASGDDQAQARLDSATLGGNASGAERGALGKPSTGTSDPVNVLQAAIAKSQELKSKGLRSRQLAEELAAYVFELQDKMLGK